MSEVDLDLMRKCGRILGETLCFLESECILPGVSTLDIAEKAHNIIRSHKGAVPAFLGYRGFPGVLCVSINEQVVHAIPFKDRIVKSGDIVSIDCGVEYEGHFTDACRTIAVGDVGAHTRKLIKTTREALDRGVAAVKVGNHIGDISYAIQKHVERHRFRVSRHFVGHGIGRVLHGPPVVPNYGPPGAGEPILAGTCLAIEPVVFDGSAEAHTQDDGWTVVSLEGNLSAHWEDTVIATEEGPEIITR